MFFIQEGFTYRNFLMDMIAVRVRRLVLAAHCDLR
jgi:hypothetical protein